MATPICGYAPRISDTSRLEAPSPAYGSRDIAELWIPSKDIPLAKTIASRMGWDFLVNYPESGLERALYEMQSGKVTEYSSFDEMMKEIDEEDGKI